VANDRPDIVYRGQATVGQNALEFSDDNTDTSFGIMTRLKITILHEHDFRDRSQSDEQDYSMRRIPPT